ncbi:MAG: hypothetical protein WC622_09950 [Pedobacter sp.]|jgi:hypothetical protein|uniref:hypothetical protein n=1 Tax=Pedobacter sp. TaxID=1411316 RepID=UPI003564F687
MKNYRLLLIFICFLAVISSFAFYNADSRLTTLIDKLDRYTNENPQEKIHVHFDKPYYSIGDDIWLKAYVVNAEENKLSLLSKVLYVDLIDERDSIRTFLLPIENGLANGNISLIDSLFAPGTYEVKAYTKWMKNFNRDYFFTTSITIGDALNGTLDANASFKLQPTEKNILLIVSISYKTLEGKPEVLKDVTYSINYQNKTLTDGKAKTDENGNVKVVYSLKKEYDPKDVNISTILAMNETMHIPRNFKVESHEDNIDLKFFPEGGDLVAGLRSKVAFKAIGNDGLGIDLKGYLEDQNKNKVAEFNSEHNGMGLFALMPNKENIYTAVISLKNGLVKRFVLPKAVDHGYVMSLNHLDEENLLLKIESAGQGIGKELILVAQTNGIVDYSAIIKMDKASITSKLSKKLFSEGIVQITLFSSDVKPIAERLVFIQPKYKLANVNIDTKESYKRREKVNMSIKISDKTDKGQVGSFSVGVINNDKVMANEDDVQTIFSNLLLTSDLRGYVEKPNYYFTNFNLQKVRHLDLLMLTQGWRRFNWADVQSEKKNDFKYNSDKGLSISGTITNLSNKPIPFGKVNLFVPSMITLIDTIADANGHFVFDELNFTDSTTFIVRAKNTKDRNNVKITIDKSEPTLFKNYSFKKLPTSSSFVQYLYHTEKMYNEMNKFGLVNKGTMLKEVVIKGRKQPVIARSAIPAFFEADYTITPENLQSAGNIASLLNKFNGVLIRNNSIYGMRKGKMGKMLVLLDGMPISDLGSVNPMALSGVQIIKGSGSSDALGIRHFSNFDERDGNAEFGIVYLTLETKRTKYNTKQELGMARVKPVGYAVTKEFYSPAYDVVNKNDKMADLRSTIYWNPNLITDEGGNVNLSFFTADEPGKYLVTLEGVTINGLLTRKTHEFVVK